ncbi:class I SAM-dependent methyltransferase [Enemella sp. A6]|uniref:class I SAM-dependent methyltransferase n=1 Tax=Enemella sp. A6 TaxID=3440152 RepID=UPI003EBC505C
MTARPTSPLAEAINSGAIELAMAQADPDSVAAATTLRKRFTPEVAAIALTQAGLRRRAATKFGAAADAWLFTPDGLEQATRPEVAAHRAARLAASGVRRVIDLGCGIGADAHAFAEAGLDVVAVERDSLTAEVARHNLTPLGVEVVQAEAEAVAGELVGRPGTAAFCDPARRGARGRTWDVSQFTPPWKFVAGLLEGPAVLKLGPGVPSEFIAPEVEAVFVSHHGDLVEAAIWSSALTERPGRAAELLTRDGAVHRMDARPAPVRVNPEVPEPGQVILEPDPAVLRAGATDALAEDLGLQRVADRVGYLIGDRSPATPFARGFEVLEVLPYREKDLRARLRAGEVGVLEIKKRGLEVDPARLRRELLGKKGYGKASATLLLTPTVAGARALVVKIV